jgi:hypothetical protein
VSLSVCTVLNGVRGDAVTFGKFLVRALFNWCSLTVLFGVNVVALVIAIGIVVTQVVNASNNMTQNEALNAGRYNHFWDTKVADGVVVPAFSNPFSHVCVFVSGSAALPCPPSGVT